MKTLVEELASYGLRIGILEPMLIRVTRQSAAIQGVIEVLRQRKDYELADKLREVALVMDDAADYAFPGLRKMDLVQ
jgi:hypothetical protein